MHHAIFWGFVILTLGTANVGDRRPRAGDPLVAARRPALGDRRRAPERRRGPGDRRRRLRALAAVRDAAGPAHVLARRDGDPAPDRRPGHRGAARRGLRVGPRTATSRARSSRTPSPSRCGRSACRTRRSRPGSPCFWWAHIVLVSAFLCYLPFSKHLHIATSRLQRLPAQARAARRAAGDGPRARGRDVRPAGRSRTSAGRTCSTASRAPNAAAARTPARPGTPASRSTPRPSSWASGT